MSGLAMHPLRNPARRLLQRAQRGAAIVELTVVLAFFFVPLLLLMLEFGRLVQTYKTLVHQTSQTARYLSVQLPGQQHDTARCLFLVGETLDSCNSSAYLLPGLSSPDFELEIADASQEGEQKSWPVSSEASARRLNLVTVTARGYPYAFTFSQLIGLPSVTLPTVSATYRQVN